MKELDNYEKACNELATAFIEKYFCDDDIKLKDIDFDWVGNKVGGVAFINDYYFSMDDIVNAIRFKAPKDRLFKYRLMYRQIPGR